MAEVQSNHQEIGRSRHRKVRAKKLSTYLDMTPMVDLAFLLLTFFMLTTTFSKPKAMEITMPVDGKPAPVNNAVTVLLGDKNRVFWYYGEFKPGKTQLTESEFSAKGIRQVLFEKNKEAVDEIKGLEKDLITGKITEASFKKSRLKILQKNSIFVLIKTDDKAKYQNVVDMLDECSIANVGKYAIVDMIPGESELLKEK
jgi:biopolymer transport protein ExbD